jgi:hypothetical protein
MSEKTSSAALRRPFSVAAQPTTALPPMRAKAATFVSWPPPPAPGSVRPSPPATARLTSGTFRKVTIEDRAQSRAVGTLDPVRVLAVKFCKLAFVRTAKDAAADVACALQVALGARAVLVHAVDERQDEIRIIGAHGGASADLLGRKVALSRDVVASSFADRVSAVTIVLGVAGHRVPERARILGAKSSLLAMRVFIGDRCVAIIEVIDSDDRYLRRRHVACAYAAERLAMSLSVLATQRKRPAIETDVPPESGCRWFEDPKDPWLD